MFEKKKEHQNSGTLGKDTINKWIISFLSVGKRGFKSNFDLATIFLLILKRLKTGVQWRELPMESYTLSPKRRVCRLSSKKKSRDHK